jgi:hypothetical protein
MPCAGGGWLPGRPCEGKAEMDGAPQHGTSISRFIFWRYFLLFLIVKECPKQTGRAMQCGLQMLCARFIRCIKKAR